MPTSENHCTDNFALPRGPKGDQGVQGIQGPVGPPGIRGPRGYRGYNGKNKIDFNIQSSGLPYTELTSPGQWVNLAYMIFPGAGSFTANEFKMAISMNTTTAIPLNAPWPTSTFRLCHVQPDNSLKTVATIEQKAVLVARPIGGKGEIQVPNNAHRFMVISTDDLQNIPSAESVFVLQGNTNTFKRSVHETRIYSAELR